MFTGIIETTGSVRTLDRDRGGLRLSVEAPSISSEFDQGASVAVNGVCLTVVDHGRSDIFRGDRTRDGLTDDLRKPKGRGPRQPGEAATVIGPYRRPPGTGARRRHGTHHGAGKQGQQPVVRCGNPGDLTPFVIEKGSIALDGISLTIAGLTGNLAAVSIIPHTASITTFGSRQIGDEVNIEVDMIGRYVASLLHSGRNPNPGDNQGPSPITEDWLKEKM